MLVRSRAQELLVEDDASRFLDQLTPEQRRPEYIDNDLPEPAASFSEEEIDAAFDALCPKL